MSSFTDPASTQPAQGISRSLTHAPDFDQSEIIDLHTVFMRLGRGLGQIIGLALLGAVVIVAGYLITSPWQSVSTSIRVVLSFPGLEKGEYPDHSKFQPDDLRSPVIVAEALKRHGLDTAGEFQSQISEALNIEGVYPPSVAKERDRLLTSGLPVQFYVPDEYTLSLSLPDKFRLTKEQRAHVLNEIVSVYRENFQRTHTKIPAGFGHVFDVLRNADFPEYEQIFNEEIDRITAYLTEQLKLDPSFRSPTTDLSFQDLLEQTQLFAQNRLSEPLELISLAGLSRNRAIAITKIDYALRILDRQERHAAEDEKVATDLLVQISSQAQNHALEIQSPTNQPQSETLTLDHGLIDSLLVTDAYGFLVHHAFDTGLKASQVRADKAPLLEQLAAMKSAKDDAGEMTQVQKSLGELELAYQELIANIRKTQEDFSSQQSANAIHISGEVTTTDGRSRKMVLTIVAGCLLGLAAGMGLSLLGIYIGSAKRG
jgi:hypothetical protein